MSSQPSVPVPHVPVVPPVAPLYSPPLLDHLRPFFAGLCLRPVLLSPVVFLLAIVWVGFGTDYGLPDQIFHEALFKQFLAGVGASLLLLQVALVAYLLDAEKPWLVAVSGRPGELGHRIDRQMRYFLDRAWLPLIALVACSVVREPLARWAFVVGAILPAAVYVPIRRLRRRHRDESRPRSPSGLALFAPGAKAERPTIPVREIVFHALLALAGASLIGYLIPNRQLEWLCFVLAWWLGLHGLMLFLYRMRTMPQRDHRRMHRRAGVAFGAFFVSYQILFIVYCLDRTGHVAAWLAPPALVTFLLVSQIVTIHGFLQYHFRGWYVLVLLGLMLLMGVINGKPRHKLQFPGLDYDVRVQLLEADFEGLYAQLLKRTSDLEEYPEDEDQFDRVMASFHRVVEANRLLDLRWRDRLALAGKLPEADGRPIDLPGPEAVATAIKEGCYDCVYDVYRSWRSATDDLGARLARLEYDGLDAWKSQTSPRPGAQKPKLAIVAVSGGANRSALWTTFVLDQLEQAFGKEKIVFPPHVRLVTGASGGMVGASYWVATLDEKLHRHVVEDHDAFVDRIAADNLTTLGHHALFLDVPTLILPGEFQSDRGVALEKAWSKNLGGALDCSVRSLASSEAQGWRPSLIFSPMLVEDGRRLLISNQYLQFLTESAGQSLANPDGDQAKPGTKRTHRPRPAGRTMQYDPDVSKEHLAKVRRDRYSLSAIEFFQLFPLAEDFRLSTAVRMSATFPYFSPAVDLPIEPRRRVVDAGYYDNYGVDVAMGWLYQYRRWLAKNTSGVVLIQLRDGASERRKLFPDDRQDFWDYTRALECVTGPLVGLGNAREAGMSFRNDEMVQVLSDYFNREGRPMFTTVVFEAQEEIALSWYLTRDEIVRMKTGFAKGDGPTPPNRKALERLVRWWKRDHSQ